MRDSEQILPVKSRVWKFARFLLLAVGVLLIFLGIALIISYPKYVEKAIRNRTQLKEGTDFFKSFLNPPYRVKSDIYIFSVENPDEILNGSKPRVSTLGPFAYDLKLWNEVVSTDRGLIKYNTYTRFYFNETESCPECHLDSKVWIPNIVYQKFVEAASSPSMKAAQTALATQTPFLEVSVDDMLFKGYKDPFLDKVCSIPFMNFICESILDLPEKIAFFDEKNETYKGTFEVSTGELDEAQSLGQLVSWNGKNVVPKQWWNSDYATMINGTDGGLFSPYIKKTDRLYIFVPDLCRSMYLVFDEESNYQGVPTYRFKVPEELFDFTQPENEAFCFNSGKAFFSENEECLPNGLIDISRCQKGEPPIVFSLPNFLYADDRVKSSISGLNESSLQHDGIILELEPRTATVLRIDRRSQANIAMWKGNDITVGADLTKMKSSVIPLFACFETFQIDDASLNLLITKLVNVDKRMSMISTIAICLGVAIVLVAIALLMLSSERVSFYLESRGEKPTAVTISPISSNKVYSIDDGVQPRYL